MSLTFPGQGRDHQQAARFTESEFWHELMDHVFGTREGGAKVLVDAEDSKLGMGKTSAAVAIARACAKAFDYDLEPQDGTLSGLEYLQRYKAHPGEEQPSVLLLDELVGAGAGDSRRSMATKNVDLARMWALARKKRVITICTLPDFGDADARLKKLADFRVQTLRQPFGAFRSYELGSHFDSSTGGVKFSRLDRGSRIFFPDMKGNADWFYSHLTDRKDDLLESEYYDADELGAEDEAEEEESQTPKELADTIRQDGIDQVVSTHSQTKKPYLNQDLIRAHYGVSHSDARAAKALLEQQSALPEPAD